MFWNVLIYFILIIYNCFCYYNNHETVSERYNYDEYLNQYRDKNFNDNYQNHYKPKDYENFKAVPLNYLCSGYSYERFGKISLGKCNQHYMVCNFVYNSGIIESCEEGYIFDRYKGCIQASSSKHCINTNKDDRDLAIIQLAKDVKFCNQGAGIYRGHTGNNICSKEILICTEQRKPILISCRPGFILSFNPLSNNLGKKIECIKKVDCQFEVTHKVTPVTMEMMVRYCQMKDNKNEYNYFKLKDEKICKNWYVSCGIDTIRELVFCPQNQIFDERIGFCRNKEYDDQCIEKKLCTKQNMWKLLPLGYCKEEYIYCHGEIPYTKRCNYHYIFDPYNMKCVPRKNVEICNKNDGKNPLIPSLTQENCKKNENIKLSCSELLKCKNGVYKKYVCPHLTRYDEKYDNCIIDKNCKKYTHINTCIEGELFTDNNCKLIFICKNGNFIEKKCISKLLNPIEYGECDKCYRDQHYNKNNNHIHNKYYHGMERESCNDYDTIPSPNKNEYYFCYDGSWYLKKCKEKKKYDHQYKMCRYNDDISNEYNYENPQIYKCIDHISPLIPDYNDCTSFSMCIKGKYRTIKCPIGSIFNPKGSIKNKNFCLSSITCPPPLYNRKCNNGEMLITKNCNKYYECYHNKWSERYCKDGRYFNGQTCSKNIICPNKDNLYPLPLPTPGYPDYTIPGKPNYPNNYCYEGSIREHEKYCNRIYKCINGKEVIKKCKGESVYSWVHKQCIFDTTYCGNKEICKNGERSNTKKTLDRINDPLFNKYSVTNFIKCYNNKWHQKRCKTGFVFDVIKLECYIKHIFPNLPENNNDNCIESGGEAGYKPHKFDCTKFYQCAHGKWIEKNCGPGTAWNQKITTCDHIGKVSSCKNNNINSY
ncbi:Chitin binding domain-containing protein [Strongyloides ratti]|uniref:Chitin binding domain-containing protein n=1 Tax=Strongyloides ratti TaxID=34506 RepID=A0A090MTU7_STRRB|nr:Chitin binding domain-containing protein [Strongyloides ratti]CEF61773.1 Chitin binding domain-containing protein [Strongyloides ratti]